MASKPAPLPLAERTDIHKSCKSLETLLNIFNDYCEAAGAIVTLQKKLAKALRDTAGMKTTGEIAANALNASANIFEVSSDIDSKFAKFSDKEYDNISSEVKKWFKKLAKEEKAHDERMANANARIKQAGQVYEKKSKKNSRDATEEHARYINLISSLGPEISQEKYNHSLNVTQRHVATIYNAAACLSRVADAEWLGACEAVRRYSPTIGQLGQWRSLCEGGWYGPVPPDLVDIDSEPQLPQDSVTDNPGVKGPESNELLPPASFGNDRANDSRESIEHGHHWNVASDPEPRREKLPRDHSPFSNQDSPVPTHHTLAPPQEPNDTSKHANSLIPLASDGALTNMDSVRSLSAFPLPPTHFPIPPRRQQTSQSQSSQSSTSYPSIPRLTESPLPSNDADAANYSGAPSASHNAPSASSSPVILQQEKPPETAMSPLASTPDEDQVRQPAPSEPQISATPAMKHEQHDGGSAAVIDQNTQHTDTINGREFGVNSPYIPKSRAADTGYFPLERTDTVGSSGSIVAAMRTRYSENSATNNSGGTAPSPPRIVNRLSGNVNDLASRYQPMEPLSSSPRLRTPSASRQPPLLPSGSPRRDGNPPQDSFVPAAMSPPSPSSPRLEEADRRRQQRLNDLAQLELKEKELALRERERDLQQKARELDRERTRLENFRETDEYGTTNDLPRAAGLSQPYPQLRPRERKISFRSQRPQSQLDAGPIQSQHSHSTTNLAPPSPSFNSAQHSRNDGQPHSPSSYTSHYSHSPAPSMQFSQSSASNPHAPYCGCESCSAAKYRAQQASPDPTSLRPPVEPITLRPSEKKPSWMRRLSMPVGNAFSLDSKKSAPASQNFGVGTGIGNTQGSRSGIFSLDGKKNASSTQLNVREDGRRSYDASGVSNRSMTNLGLGLGRR